MSLTNSQMVPLEQFTANPERTLAALRTSGEPLELVAAGGQAIVIQDAAHYRKMIAEFDRLEAIAAIKESFRDSPDVRTWPVREAFAELARKHRLPPLEAQEQ